MAVGGGALFSARETEESSQSPSVDDVVAIVSALKEDYVLEKQGAVGRASLSAMVNAIVMIFRSRGRRSTHGTTCWQWYDGRSRTCQTQAGASGLSASSARS